MIEGYGRHGAFGSVLKDESGEKETTAEEVDCEGVERAAEYFSKPIYDRTNSELALQYQQKEGDDQCMLGLPLHRQRLLVRLGVRRCHRSILHMQNSKRERGATKALQEN